MAAGLTREGLPTGHECGDHRRVVLRRGDVWQSHDTGASQHDTDADGGNILDRHVMRVVESWHCDIQRLSFVGLNRHAGEQTVETTVQGLSVLYCK